MKLLDGGTFFLLIALFVGFIFAEDADAGEWYGSVGVGAATRTPDPERKYALVEGKRVYLGTSTYSADVRDFAIVEAGHRWRFTQNITAKLFYFHFSSPTTRGDGNDGLFASLEFTM